MIIAPGQFFLIKFDQDTLANGFIREKLLLRLRTIAPENLLRLAQLDHLLHPTRYMRILHVARPQLHMLITATEAASKQGGVEPLIAVSSPAYLALVLSPCLQLWPRPIAEFSG